MSSPAAPVYFDCCRAQIDELLHAHADMGVVERTIDDTYALDREEKDALWVWAAGRRDRLVSDASDCPTIGSTVRIGAGDPTDDLRYPRGAGHD